jgi:dihydrofolate reductase
VANTHAYASLDAALAALAESPWKEVVEQVFVVGGAQIYRQAIAHPACRQLLLTRITVSLAAPCA